MSGYLFAVSMCVVVVALVVGLLRTRRVREKYAGIWLLVATGVCVLGAFPAAVFWLAHTLGVRTPVNLVFSGAVAVLLLVCIQLSVEISGLEEETRTIAEELALLRLELDEVRASSTSPVPPSGPRRDPPG